MAKIEKLKYENGEIIYVFFCPGCNENHSINKTWQFNSDYENPTIKPSIMVQGSMGGKHNQVCHSFVKNGQIQFLNDCTHELKGQTVELPEIIK